MSNLDPTQTVINSLHYDGNLYVGMGDYRVLIIDIDNYKQIHSIDVNVEVRSVKADNTHIFIGTLDEKIQVVNINDYSIIGVLDSELGVTSLHIDKDYLYSTGFKNLLHIYDNHNLELKVVLNEFNERINSVVSNEHFIITGEGFRQKGIVKFFDKKNNSLTKEIDSSTKRITKLCLDDDILVVGETEAVKLIDTIDYTSKNIDIGFNGDIREIVVDEKYYYITDKDTLFVINKENLEIIKRIEEPSGDLNGIIITEDKILYSSRDTIRFLSKDDLEPLYSMKINKL